MTSHATKQQIDAFQQVFDALFEFVDWAFGAVPGPAERADFEHRVLASWAHPDGTVQQLFVYLGGLHTTVFGQPERSRERYRREVRRLFAGMFSAADPTERGQVLALLHRILEHARPGCTGVTPPVPASPWPIPASAPAATLQQWPSHPQSAPPVSAPVGPHPFAAAPQAHAWPPAQPQPAIATGHGPSASPGMPAQGAATVPQLQQMVIDEQIRQQRLLMDQKLWDMKHSTAMEIIRSMR